MLVYLSAPGYLAWRLSTWLRNIWALTDDKAAVYDILYCRRATPDARSFILHCNWQSQFLVIWKYVFSITHSVTRYGTPTSFSLSSTLGERATARPSNYEPWIQRASELLTSLPRRECLKSLSSVISISSPVRTRSSTSRGPNYNRPTGWYHRGLWLQLPPLNVQLYV